MSLAILHICSAGDHVVSSSQLYGGSFNLLRLTLKRFGIETTFVKPRDVEGFKKAIQPNTKCIWGELIGNPGIEIMDVPEISKIAKEANIPLMVDGTFNTPYLCNLFDLGADIITHSLTKWMAGHGTSMGGIIDENGDFGVPRGIKFPTLTEHYVG